MIILLFIITIICYHYAKHSSKRKKKTYCRTNNIIVKNNEFQKVRIKNCTCYYFDSIIKFEDFYFGNILIDEKSHKSFDF